MEPRSGHEVPGPATSRRAGFAGPRILIVGHGDVGRRLAALLVPRHRVFATTRSPDRVASLRATGVEPIVADLDDASTLARLGGLAPTVVHLAPPPSSGDGDPRLGRLLPVLRGVRTLVYVGTSGVYGDARGARVDETRPVAPESDRARRRVDAERRLRAWARHSGARVTILRAPGIYAGDRLPVERIRRGAAVLAADDDVYTNHVHADDLARAVVAALARGAPQRVYHASDDSEIRMGDWFDAVADAYRLPRPRRVPAADIASQVAPATLSFMRESRRLSNRRLKAELALRLDYPTVFDGLAASTASRTG